MFFALFRAKMTVFDRQIKLDGGVALTRKRFATPHLLYSASGGGVAGASKPIFL